MKPWVKRLIIHTTLVTAAFTAGYIYKPVGYVQEVTEVITTAADGVKTVTKTATKQPVSVKPADSLDIYRPNYSASISRGIFEQFRVEAGYRILGNLWITGGYSSHNDVSIGLRIDF